MTTPHQGRLSQPMGLNHVLLFLHVLFFLLGDPELGYPGCAEGESGLPLSHPLLP